MEKMRFYHIIGRKRNSTYGLTIATELEPREENGERFPKVVTCAVSYCAPVEKNFSRPKGRIISSSRLKSDKPMESHKKFSVEVETYKDLKVQVISWLLTDPNAPIWAHNIINKELARTDEKLENIPF